MKLVIATNNEHKVHEISSRLEADNANIELLKLKDINCFDEIPETQPDLEGNALQKAHYIYDRYNVNCFADDTGLEIDALDGEPGVYSARYAGESRSFEENMNKVLKNLEGKENRKACFRTIIALILNGKEYLFEGRVDGVITKDKRGIDGFGYDPIFLPNNYRETFAQMSLSEKNKISHRALAVEKLIEFLVKQ